MKLIAEKRIAHLTEENNAHTSEMFEVDPSETIASLLDRMAITGRYSWQFSELEIRIRLVRERIEP